MVAVTLVLVGSAARPLAAQAIPSPLVTVVDIEVNSVSLDDGNLVANAEITLNVAGQTITREIEIPLTVGAIGGEDGACDILNLALGPVDLDLLGLVVMLDDCSGGPLTVDITGTDDGLLGSLLCDLAGGLLDPDAVLGDLLGALPAEDLADITGAIADVLNEVLDEVLDTAPVPAAMHARGSSSHRCDILSLEVPDGLELDVLGLQVVTSPICLDVFAERGNGNLLGNLLCTLTNLLDNRGNNIGGQRALVRNILRIVDTLANGD